MVPYLVRSDGKVRNFGIHLGCQYLMSILVDLVNLGLVDLWPVNPKMGFERPCQSTLGFPIDFNVKLDLRF